MCGGPSIEAPIPPSPPSIVIPPEIAEKRDVVTPQGKFDPVARKYIFRRAGVPQYKIPSKQEQESKTSSGGQEPT